MALLHRLKMLRHEIQQNVKRVKNSKLSNMKLISNYYMQQVFENNEILIYIV